MMMLAYNIITLDSRLIAMMNNTYSLIISQSERAWSFQWARTLFALERRLTDRERALYLRRYSISVVSSQDHEQDDEAPARQQVQTLSGAQVRHVPGLMIIRRMEQTRAERHRLIVDYWQVSSGGALRPEAATNARVGPLAASHQVGLEEERQAIQGRHLGAGAGGALGQTAGGREMAPRAGAVLPEEVNKDQGRWSERARASSGVAPG